jgi:hypothetical protein
MCLGGESSSPHRSPIDIAVLPGARALTANHTSDSASLVDLEHEKVLAEARWAASHRPSPVPATAGGPPSAICGRAR